MHCSEFHELFGLERGRVDLGPNVSVTGSLATILWLLALRREGLQVSAWRFLLLGSVVMPLALAAAFAIYDSGR